MVEGMRNMKVIEELRGAFAEMGFVPPEVSQLLNFDPRIIDNTVNGARDEVESYAMDTIRHAADIILYAERGEWDRVASLASLIGTKADRIRHYADVGRRAARLKERVTAILEKDLKDSDV
jgi:hypothetical protein